MNAIRIWNRAFAPGLLLLVAAVHFVLVFSRDLSPWKGGGFGMFSTVDSPGARYLKAYLVFEHGEMQIDIPRRLKREARLVRTLPSVENLDTLAKRLASQTWVRWNYHEHYLASDPTQDSASDLPLESAALDQSLDSGKTDPLGASPDDPALSEEQLRSQGSYPKLRILGRSEPEPPPEQKIQPLGTRIELWKYHFENQSNQLLAERLLQSEASAQP